jgi:hypothetical protein
MTKEREKLELRIGWDLSSYSQEQIEKALKMNDEDAIEYLLLSGDIHETTKEKL